MQRFILTILSLSLVNCATTTKADRERAALHLQIGTAFLSRGQYPQAMQELLRAERLDPKNPLILNNLGLAYYVRGHIKEAEEKIRRAIDLEDKYSDAKNNLARILIDRKQYNEALRWLAQVEGDLTYPHAEKTYVHFGMVYFEKGQYRKAEEYFLRSLGIRRENCMTANYYGRTLMELKKTKQSAQMLDQAVEYCRTARFEEPLYFSAMSYFSLGDREKSRARLNELLKDYPQSKYVAKAKGLLQLLEQ